MNAMGKHHRGLDAAQARAEGARAVVEAVERTFWRYSVPLDTHEAVHAARAAAQQTGGAS